MLRLLLVLGLIGGLLPLTGCGLLKKRLLARKYSRAQADKNADVFIGTVESVNPEQKFVLIRTDLRMVVAPGTRLESVTVSGRRSSLEVTPERKMNLLSADISEGLPSVGDVVVLPAHGTAPAAPAEGAEANPAPAGAASASGPAAPKLLLPNP